MQQIYLILFSCALAFIPALVIGGLAGIYSEDVGSFTTIFVFVSLVGVLMTKTPDTDK